MIHKTTLEFLKALKKNNNRDWFTKNKLKYFDAKKDFEVFTQELIEHLAEFDKSLDGLFAKDCLFRIYRDVRFSKDKTPYKTNFGASIQAGGRKAERAGYYFHIEPGMCMLAGGRYLPPTNHLMMIRKYIFTNYKALDRIVNENNYKKTFGELWGDKLKTAPKGFPKEHPSVKYIRLTSFIAYCEMKDQAVLSKKFISEAAKKLKLTYPLIKFLDKACGI